MIIKETNKDILLTAEPQSSQSRAISLITST